MVTDQPHQSLEGARGLVQAGVSHFLPGRTRVLVGHKNPQRSMTWGHSPKISKGALERPAHLCKVLLGDPPRPFNAQVQGAARVGHVSTLNHHALDQDLVFR